METVREYNVKDLLKAVKANRMDCIQAILDAGQVNVNALGRVKFPYGEDTRTALAYACELGNINAVSLLLSCDDIQVNALLSGEPMREDSVEDLLEAVKAGQVDRMQGILDAGHVDVNAEGEIEIEGYYGRKDTRTALAYACERGRPVAVAFLLSRDDIQVSITCGKHGKSALMYAIDKGYLNVARLLLDHGGVDINLVDKVRADSFAMSWSLVWLSVDFNFDGQIGSKLFSPMICR
ncbi:Aste57867_22585 [Aphanomyces stellatus]|uniref:Aste57867_22585 protein n=1 Tax=Aphanomyces stellatus TaxID=120398 RepID=A0A485LQB9_9STRA|nr:hypothetical protein As57867_022515 [Aphanomyces stellatus]VFT99243.1 Aste57867_22585 [Aphanomyces stellatus]